MNFFQELLKIYSTLKIPIQYNEISKIDKAISWYLADNTKQFITVSKMPNNNIIEIDIRQAFTTICRCLFDANSTFIIELNKIQDKKSRNIFIATSLVNSEYLRLLNIICKVIIMGILLETNNFTLLELKKDGATINCDDETLSQLISIHETPLGQFSEKVIQCGFQFHFTQYYKYIRSHRTSYFWDNNSLEIKGIYKHVPKKISELQFKLFHDEDIDFNEISNIYSQKYFTILTSNNLRDILNDYYLCSNKRYLAEDGKYIIRFDKQTISAKNYMRTFLFPIILSNKI